VKSTNVILARMGQTQKFILITLFCAAFLWFAGPIGQFLVILPLLLFGPGYLIERTFPHALPLPALVRPALWLGLSLSLIALLYQWTTLVGLALTPLILAGLTLACAGGVLWASWHDAAAYDRQRREHPASAVAHWWVFPFLGILGLTFWTRFQQIQELVLPAWVDSVHHALLIRVAAETGQAPYSLQPYLPIDSLPYHWGYHAFTATVMNLSGLMLPQVMLWEGQILNALHVVTCAALAAYLWRRPVAALVAGLVVGLISIMPAFYVSWGRYTQLMGLLLLPAIAITWHMALQTSSRRWWSSVALLLAGLSIIHFRVIIFTLCLLAVVGLVWTVDQSWRRVWARFWSAVGMAGLSLALALPWLWVVVSHILLPAVDQPESLVGGGNYNAVNMGLLWAGQNRWLFALALLAAGWGIARRSRVVIVQVGWVCALVVVANPWLISYILPPSGLLLALWGQQQRRWLLVASGGGLMLVNPVFVQIPYFWLITNDTVVISLFIPAAMLIAGGAGMFVDWVMRLSQTTFSQYPAGAHMATLHFQAVPILPRWPRFLSPVLLFMLLSGFAVWGAWNLRTVINPVTVFVTPAEVPAIEWVAENTPEDARFLINAASWLSTAERGADGGWWLMPLTGRWTSTPPVLFTYGSPDYVQEVRERTTFIREFDRSQPGQEEQLYELIDREQISHIYLTEHSGPLKPELFADIDRFEKVYEQADVIVYRVINGN